MKSKSNILIIIMVLLLSTTVFNRAYSGDDTIEMLNSKIEDINESILYLDAHHINTFDVQDKYDDVIKTRKQYLASLKTKSRCKYDTLLKELLELKVDALETNLNDQVASVKRLDLLFKIMLFFGALIGITFAIYIVVMFNKRK